MNLQSSRIDVADALRGFSVLGILLVHCVEHYNLMIYPEVTGELMKFSDAIVWSSVFFIFGGKAYAIFALLFGFSFFIQDNNQLKKGYDFRWRFLWRLALLFVWGNINSIFYTGDILVLFSLTGILLLLVARLSNKAVLWIALILLVQPFEWGKIVYALLNPDYEGMPTYFMPYFEETMRVLSAANLIDSIKLTLTTGQAFSFLWAVENGRLFQTAALFMFGMLIGRADLFRYSEKNIKFWRWTLVIGILCFFPLNGLMNIVPKFVENKAILTPLMLVLESLTKFAFLSFLVALIIITFYQTKMQKVWSKLIPLGKMSLTIYILQSVMGAFVFYNWGLGMSAKLSATESLLLAPILFAIQYTFAYYWLKYHKQGPLEYVWKKATWIGHKPTK